MLAQVISSKNNINTGSLTYNINTDTLFIILEDNSTRNKIRSFVQKENFNVVYINPIEKSLYSEEIIKEILKEEFSEAEKNLNLTINFYDNRYDFKRYILDWVENFQILALGYILQSYIEKKLSAALLSEILELIGLANLSNLEEIRTSIFRYIFFDKNVEIRHGVVEGISNLSPQIAIPLLEESLLLEDNMVLRKMIVSYIEQLTYINNNQ